MKVTNITSTVLEKRLGITSKQQEVLIALQSAFEEVHSNGMGAREITVMLHDLGPGVLDQVNEFQPFAFATVYFDDELFLRFTNGDAWAIEEATFPQRKAPEPDKGK